MTRLPLPVHAWQLLALSPSDAEAQSATAALTAALVIGTDGNDSLTGTAGDDTLDGGLGADTLVGGKGNDLYRVDNVGDVLVEAGSSGEDSVESSVSWTLASNLEHLTLIGGGQTNATGNTLSNRLTGNSGDNLLTGWAGNDTLQGMGGTDTLDGGAGNDTYVVDSLGDILLEAAASGKDTVMSSVDFSLGDNFENLTLTGSADINATGNAASNVLTGNTGANILAGGAGGDTYYVDNPGDQVIEAPSSGTDTVNSSISWTLGANVERLVLTGSAAIAGTGNTQSNVITGNLGNNLLSGLSGNDTLTGGSGNDTLDGGIGNDSLVGGSGDDSYAVDSVTDMVVEQAGEGTDSVTTSLSITLAAELENLSLTGSANLTGTGNTGNNQITGNAGNNTLIGGDGHDSLDGGAGADSLIGGLGDDTFSVDTAGDMLVEAAGEGTDTVVSSISFNLADNFEHLTLIGSNNIDATGNGANNLLTGNTGANVLVGAAGNDTVLGDDGSDDLTGDAGNDSLLGGGGSDYIDGGDGNDFIDLGDGDDGYYGGGGGNGNDTVLGGAGNDYYLAGDAGNDSVNGGLGNDYLVGTSATGQTDTLVGGEGDDYIDCGAGIERIVFDTLIGSDTVFSFKSGVDKLVFSRAGLLVGDGDASLEGALSTGATGGFATAAELVIFTSNIAAADITATAAAAQIGSAASAYALGQTALFVVDNGVDSAVFYFKSADTNATVSASELTWLANLSGTSSTVVADYLFGA